MPSPGLSLQTLNIGNPSVARAKRQLAWRPADVFRHLHPDEAEHSWAGRADDGYRYDHAFCCRSLASRIAARDYLHQPRFDGLSDHSALTMHLAVTPPVALPPTSH
jgi:exonuclease III